MPTTQCLHPDLDGKCVLSWSSTFFLLGQGTGGDETRHLPATSYGLHHPHFALDESVLSRGVELHANLAIRGLKKLLGHGSELRNQQLQNDESKASS